MMTDEAKQARNKYMSDYKRNISEEAKEQRNKYQREWRQRNAEKQKQYNIDYWERKATAAKPGMSAETRAMMARCVDVPMCEVVDSPYKAEAKQHTEDEATYLIEEIVIALDKKGHSLRAIGQKLNVSHMTIKRILSKCNNE